MLNVVLRETTQRNYNSNLEVARFISIHIIKSNLETTQRNYNIDIYGTTSYIKSSGDFNIETTQRNYNIKFFLGGFMVSLYSFA